MERALAALHLQYREKVKVVLLCHERHQGDFVLVPIFSLSGTPVGDDVSIVLGHLFFLRSRSSQLPISTAFAGEGKRGGGRFELPSFAMRVSVYSVTCLSHSSVVINPVF